MGLSNRFLNDLCDLKKRGELDAASSIIEIGAQQLSNAFLRSDAQIAECYGLFGAEPIALGSPIDAGTRNGMECQSEENPSSRQFWQSLGFSYAAIEFDGHRDSTPLDLNRDKVSRRLRGKFDLIVNAGTTEHVANQDNAFKVMHDLCKVGGIMFSELPAGGMMTHGLVTYTPKFFWHLCRENNYKAVILRVSNGKPNPIPQDIRDSNLMWSPSGDPIGQDVTIPDFIVVAALKKVHDRPFVTPLDVPPEVMPKKRERFDLFSYFR